MSNVLEYKGYHARIEYDAIDKILHGKIEGIEDLVNFESDSVEEIEEEFHTAVDDYLLFCEDVGKTPEKEYSGSFNIRIGAALHKKIAKKAFKQNISVNSAVIQAVDRYVNNSITEIGNYLNNGDISSRISGAEFTNSQNSYQNWQTWS